MQRRRIVLFGMGGVAAFLAFLVVVGTVAVAHDNPPVTYTVQWNSPRTEELARRACFDCHSNETVWPIYSYVAPMSFLIAKDVQDGRKALNFSVARGEKEGHEMAEEIEEGGMPLPIYLPLHPAANLTDAEKQELIKGLRATFPG